MLRNKDWSLLEAERIPLIDKIDIVLETLPPQKEAVIRLRFGLDDGIPRTTREIAEILKIRIHQVRQRENSAMWYLRHPTRSKLLRDYI